MKSQLLRAIKGVKPMVGMRTVDGLLALIARERQGDSVDRMRLKNLLRMFNNVEMHMVNDMVLNAHEQHGEQRKRSTRRINLARYVKRSGVEGLAKWQRAPKRLFGQVVPQLQLSDKAYKQNMCSSEQQEMRRFDSGIEHFTVKWQSREDRWKDGQRLHGNSFTSTPGAP
eukprot:scaffold97174_cov18-Tisochrysis_lutea.AAC.1